MTGKEALKEVIIEQQLLISEVANPENHKSSKEIMELYDVISKDLEALEILLKYDVLSVIGIDEDREDIKWYIATHKDLYL